MEKLRRVWRITYIDQDISLVEFAKAAARDFVEHPEHHSFTSEEIEPGCLFALRWGLDGKSVLVLKLDEEHMPTLFQQAITESEEQP